MTSVETYDANGNTLSSGGRTFAYASENRLTSMNNGAVRIIYDGDGNRSAETAGGVTTRYLVEDDMNPTGLHQVFDELTGSAVTRTYTYGLQRISQSQSSSGAWTPRFYGYDGGGTVRQLTSLAGAVTDTYNYDAFGNLLNSTGSTRNNYLYRGDQYDSDLNLYYLRARYYNFNTGRILSRDPEDGITTDPTTLHKYADAGGDPVNYYDPTGRATRAGTLGGGVGEYVGVLALISIATIPQASLAVSSPLPRAMAPPQPASRPTRTTTTAASTPRPICLSNGMATSASAGGIVE